MRDKADRGSSSNRVALDVSGLTQFIFLTLDLRYPDITLEISRYQETLENLRQSYSSDFDTQKFERSRFHKENEINIHISLAPCTAQWRNSTSGISRCPSWPANTLSCTCILYPGKYFIPPVLHSSGVGLMYHLYLVYFWCISCILADGKCFIPPVLHLALTPVCVFVPGQLECGAVSDSMQMAIEDSSSSTVADCH